MLVIIVVLRWWVVIHPQVAFFLILFDDKSHPTIAFDFPVESHLSGPRESQKSGRLDYDNSHNTY